MKLTHSILGKAEERRDEALTKLLRFVVGQLVAHESARGHDPLQGIDVERMMTALEYLDGRDNLELTPFVYSWHPLVDTVGQPQRAENAFEAMSAKDDINKIAGSLSTNLGQGAVWLGQAVERLIFEIAQPRQSPNYSRALTHCHSALVEILREHQDTSYLGPLFDETPDGGARTIFTLNYDLTIEDEGRERGRNVDTGIDGWMKGAPWRWTDDGIRLLKLHGSIDWRIDTRAEQRRTLPEYRIEIGIAENDPPAIIFGGAQKLRAEGPFLELLAEFEALLSKHERILVVGYSFRDAHVNEIVRRWLNRSAIRRMVVVDPSEKLFWQWPMVGQSRLFTKDLEQALMVSRVFDHATKSHRDVVPRLVHIKQGTRDGLSSALALCQSLDDDLWRSSGANTD